MKEFDLIIHYDRIGESDMYNCHEVGELVRCKDCKHKPTGSGVNHDVTFPDRDYRCPCRCEDYWYSWMPDDDWFCGNGERKDESTMGQVKSTGAVNKEVEDGKTVDNVR